MPVALARRPWLAVTPSWPGTVGQYRCGVLARLDLRGVADLRVALPRPSVSEDAAVVDAVREILASVRTGGDDAVRELTKRFDGVDVDDPLVPADECKRALEHIAPALR